VCTTCPILTAVTSIPATHFHSESPPPSLHVYPSQAHIGMDRPPASPPSAMSPPLSPPPSVEFEAGVATNLKVDSTAGGGSLSKTKGSSKYEAAFTESLITARSAYRGVRFQCSTTAISSGGAGWKMMGLKSGTSEVGATANAACTDGDANCKIFDFGFACSSVRTQGKATLHYDGSTPHHSPPSLNTPTHHHY
jgi:hypothetical protein